MIKLVVISYIHTKIDLNHYDVESFLLRGCSVDRATCGAALLTGSPTLRACRPCRPTRNSPLWELWTSGGKITLNEPFTCLKWMAHDGTTCLV